MSSKAKVVIKIETHKLTIVRPLSEKINLWCELCAAEIETVSPKQAAFLLGLTGSEIYRAIESDKLHLIEPKNQSSFICINSLNTYKLEKNL